MTREMLESYQDKVREVGSIDRMLERIDGRLYAPTKARRDGMPRGLVCHAEDVRDEKVDEKTEVRAMYEKKRQHLLEDLMVIEQAIDVLPSRDRAAVRMHYVEGVTISVVAERMHYSQRQMERILAAAVRRLCG